MEHENGTITKKRGVKYKVNPFISSEIVKHGSRKIANKEGDRLMVVNVGTGELLAPAGFWQTQKVDRTQFVKLYINGVRAFKDLTSAGTRVFEVLYLKVQENIGKDQILLAYNSIDQMITPLSRSIFFRGMKELVEKDFIAESMIPGVYYLNPDFLWNGDRLTFVHEFIKESGAKEAKEALGTSTIPKIFKDF